MKIIFLTLLLVTMVLDRSARCDEIHEAARAGDVAKVKTLLTANPGLANAKDSQGLRPLFWAAQSGQTAVAELLLANKAEVNAKTDQGLTPLHAAAVFGKKAVVEILLARGAEVNAKDNLGLTPL